MLCVIGKEFVSIIHSVHCDVDDDDDDGDDSNNKLIVMVKNSETSLHFEFGIGSNVYIYDDTTTTAIRIRIGMHGFILFSNILYICYVCVFFLFHFKSVPHSMRSPAKH